MEGLAGTAALMLLWLLLLLGTSAATVNLKVTYPKLERNFSFVTLQCLQATFNDPLPPEQRPVTFLRNGTEIRKEDVVSLEICEDITALLVINRVQEGDFSCRSATGVESTRHSLAGSSERWIIARIRVYGCDVAIAEISLLLGNIITPQ